MNRNLFSSFVLTVITISLYAQDLNILWQNTIGGNEEDTLWDMDKTLDGGYIIGGRSESDISGDKTVANHGNGTGDFWVLKLDASGNILWQNSIGGTFDEHLYSLISTTDGGYLLGGLSNSNISGDKTENSQGDLDYWVLQIDNVLSLEENPFTTAITLYPNPAKNTLQISTQDKTIDQVNIYTITGSKVLQLEVNTVSPTVDVSRLAAGVYYVQLYSGKNVAVKKFVKE